MDASENLVALVKHVEQRVDPTVLTVARVPLGTHEVPVLVHPEGQEVTSLKPFMDAFKERPERRSGTARAQDLTSLIAHLNRHKGGDTVVFADALSKTPSITGVYDYNEAGGEAANESGDGGSMARWQGHRARYDFPLSEEWQAWHKQNGQKMSQADFAAFLEERLLDVMVPPTKWPDLPTESEAGGDFGERTPMEDLAYLAATLKQGYAGPGTLMDLSRGLTITADGKVTNAQVLQSGEVTLTYSEVHKDGSGQPVKVPALFLIAIPIFRFGQRYMLAVRLRYRVAGGTIIWFFELYRADRAFDHAVRETCKKVQAETNLPLFYGAPEVGTASS